MKENLHAIILAGGKGTRMKSELPKCAYPFNGKPMVSYIIDACKQAGIEDIVVIVGYKYETLVSLLPNDVKWVRQEEQLGTAHAAKCAYPLLKDKDGLTLIFPGDMPLIDATTIKNIVSYHMNHNNQLTDVSIVLDDPAAFGRIYRENGKIKKIIEFKDCTEEQKRIKEINIGLFCVDNKLLFSSLDKIKNKNNAKEFYLTDIVEVMLEKYKVDAYIAPTDYRFIGVNSVDELKALEEEYLNHFRG